MIYDPKDWKQLIYDTGMKQWEFAAKYKIIHSHLSAMCNDRKDPHLSTVRRISSYIAQERAKIGLPV